MIRPHGTTHPYRYRSSTTQASKAVNSGSVGLVWFTCGNYTPSIGLWRSKTQCGSVYRLRVYTGNNESRRVYQEVEEKWVREFEEYGCAECGVDWVGGLGEKYMDWWGEDSGLRLGKRPEEWRGIQGTVISKIAGIEERRRSILTSPTPIRAHIRETSLFVRACCLLFQSLYNSLLSILSICLNVQHRTTSVETWQYIGSCVSKVQIRILAWGISLWYSKKIF